MHTDVKSRSIPAPKLGAEVDASDHDIYGEPVKKKSLTINKPAQFTENSLVEYVKALTDAGRHEQALSYLIEILPEFAKSNVNRKEKQNHLLFLPRLIQSGSNTKHGYHKLMRKAHGVIEQTKGFDCPKGGAFVDFGCGAHDPAALATYFYANGFSRGMGIDMLPARVPLYSAMSMFDIITNMRTYPKRYALPGTDANELVKRLRVFNLAAFERGEFDQGMATAKGQVDFEVTDISASTLAPQSVSLLVSFAVFEHVMDMKAVCAKIYDALMPGGIAYHFIDMADHRSYRDDGKFGALAFLTEESGPANINRLRKHEQIAFQREAGFEILRTHHVNSPMTPELRAALAPRFKDMSDDDVSTTKLHIVLRKPASV